jgi:hypothetical protein
VESAEASECRRQLPDSNAQQWGARPVADDQEGGSQMGSSASIERKTSNSSVCALAMFELSDTSGLCRTRPLCCSQHAAMTLSSGGPRWDSRCGAAYMTRGWEPRRMRSRA